MEVKPCAWNSESWETSARKFSCLGGELEVWVLALYHCSTAEPNKAMTSESDNFVTNTTPAPIFNHYLETAAASLRRAMPNNYLWVSRKFQGDSTRIWSRGFRWFYQNLIQGLLECMINTLTTNPTLSSTSSKAWILGEFKHRIQESKKTAQTMETND